MPIGYAMSGEWHSLSKYWWKSCCIELDCHIYV